MKIILYLLLFMCYINNCLLLQECILILLYIPTGHKYETKEKYEICRLKKEIRRPTEIKCFYIRQDKKGSELIITNDQPTFSCLKQINCKIE